MITIKYITMKHVKFYRIKDEIRILGIDDSPFSFRDDSVLLVGCIFRGGKWLDGVLSTRVEVDGLDATEKIIDMVKNCKFKDLRVIMLDGLGFGGFNLVDIKKIFRETKLPVIVIIRQMPDFREINPKQCFVTTSIFSTLGFLCSNNL